MQKRAFRNVGPQMMNDDANVFGFDVVENFTGKMGEK